PQAAAGARAHVHGLEAQSSQSTRAIDSDNEPCRAQPRPVAQEDRAVPSQLRPDDFAAETHVDAVLPKDVSKRSGHGGFFLRDQPRRALHDRDFRTEPRQPLSGLASHGSAAAHDYGIGKLGPRRALPARPSPLAAE